jgi:integrase
VSKRRRVATNGIELAVSVRGEALVVIQRQLGHADLRITSVYLQGIDNAEIIDTVRARHAPMIPARTTLFARR